ncbi:MAG: OsmC family protein [Xanthomonadaceae bacterium]|jgi:uncharacterized OsmC-like protein|nr:OsmC family protein [Xanthomonadaceae bacterium]
MSESQPFSVTVQQESDYVFRVIFDETTAPDLITDAMLSPGPAAGPNPTRMLAAAVGNCLIASLLFALQKFKNQPGPLTLKAMVEMGRNEQGRLRVAHIHTDIRLAGRAGQYQHLERLLEQFEDFCVVTQSVRDGVEISVDVHDADGVLLHHSGQN